MKIFVFFIFLISLSGCAGETPPWDAKSDAPLMKRPYDRILEPQGTLSHEGIDFEDISFSAQKRWRVLTSKSEVEKQTDNYIHHGQADVITRPDGTVLYPYGLTEAYLTTRKMMYSKIILQEGEKIMSVACGDTMRWHILPAYIGDPKIYTPIILVKPFMEGLQSSLSVITDKRDYDILIRSVASGDYMPRIGFYYPQDKADAMGAALPPDKIENDRSLQPKINIENIKYDYRVSGDSRLEWYPVKVFEDGHKVFIKMPDHIDHAQLPVFMALDSHHQVEMVNYRWARPYYVIDTIFRQGILVLGTEKYKQVIQLTKVS